MNERLEKECREYARTKEHIYADTYGRGLLDIAQHFYSLALEDVRKEVENCIKRNAENFRKGVLSVESLAARDGQMMALRTFLDQLSK